MMTKPSLPKDRNRDTRLLGKDPQRTMIGKDLKVLPRVQTVIDVYPGSNYNTLWSVSLSGSCLRYDGRVDERGNDPLLLQFTVEGAMWPLLIKAKTEGVALNAQDIVKLFYRTEEWNLNRKTMGEKSSRLNRPHFFFVIYYALITLMLTSSPKYASLTTLSLTNTPPKIHVYLNI